MGTGGNISKLYRMSTPVLRQGYLPVSELQRLYDHIVSLPLAERIERLRMNPDRADVIEHAARIYLQIMKWGAVGEIIAPQAGLKEGLIIELIRKHGLLTKK
jgi:exopolyphosphatase/guanosine-5'-triphosphate,3'-diphosphate pyrophosphatase